MNAHLNRSSVDVCTLTRTSFGLLLLIKHLTPGNREFIQLDEPWKGNVLCSRWVVALPPCTWSPAEILVTQQGVLHYRGPSESQGGRGGSVALRWTRTRHKAHTEPNAPGAFQGPNILCLGLSCGLRCLKSGFEPIICSENGQDDNGKYETFIFNIYNEPFSCVWGKPRIPESWSCGTQPRQYFVNSLCLGFS